jgi:hypothetical protein
VILFVELSDNMAMYEADVEYLVSGELGPMVRVFYDGADVTRQYVGWTKALTA